MSGEPDRLTLPISIAGCDWSAMPNGTRAHSSSGGYWERVATGWQWMTRWSTFPTPGADVSHVSYPVGVEAYERQEASGGPYGAVQLTQDAVTSHVLDKTPLPDACYVTSSDAHPPTRQVHRAVVRLQTKKRDLVMPGDWIVHDADGALSVCKPEVFAERYEARDPEWPALTADEVPRVHVALEMGNTGELFGASVAARTPDEMRDAARELLLLADWFADRPVKP